MHSPCTHTVFACAAASSPCEGCVALPFSPCGHIRAEPRCCCCCRWAEPHGRLRAGPHRLCAGPRGCLCGASSSSARGLVVCVRDLVVCVRGLVVVCVRGLCRARVRR